MTAGTDGDDDTTGVASLTVRWREFLELPYPSSGAGAPVDRQALALLNALVRLCVDTLLETRRLEERRIAALGIAHGEMTRVLAGMEDGDDRRYMARLNELARLALDVVASPRSSDGPH